MLLIIDGTLPASYVSSSLPYEDSALAVDSVSTITNIVGGRSFADNKRLCVAFDETISYINAGLPYTSEGRLCVSANPTAYVSSGTPFTSTGHVSVTGATPPIDTDFVFIIDTRLAGSTPANTFLLPALSVNSVLTYNFTVEWGDGTSQNITLPDYYSHVYPAEGIYEIRISGIFPSIAFNNTDDAAKVISIEKFGTVGWKQMTRAFFGCVNLTTVTYGANTDTSNVVSCSNMFRACTSLEFGDISNFDTSNVARAQTMFRDCPLFNLDVSGWNTSSLINGTSMFRDALAFNQDLSSWDVTSVESAAGFLQNSSFSTANYDLLLVSWGSQTTQPNVSFNAGSAQYNAGPPAAGRAALAANSWTITDGGSV